MDVEVIRQGCGKKLPEFKNLKEKKRDNNIKVATIIEIMSSNNFATTEILELWPLVLRTFSFYAFQRIRMFNYLTRSFKKRLFVSRTNNLLGNMIF